MRQEHRLGSDTPALPGLRTFIVPPDIIAVPRRSPERPRKHTPWKKAADGQQVVDRTGGRDWFGAHLSSQAAQPRWSRIYSASLLVNLAAIAAVSALVMSRERPAVPEADPPLFVSVALALGSPIAPEPPAPDPAAETPPARGDAPRPRAEEPAVSIEAPAPLEAPAAIEPEVMPPSPGPAGEAVGLPDGGDPAGTAAEGPASGTATSGSGAPEGPVRLTEGIEPPRKLKDVKAVYPPMAMARQLGGTVVIEATISADGRVVDAVVRKSVPHLDDAALDAVRRWEYAPARINGIPIAVIMSVAVTFAIL